MEAPATPKKVELFVPDSIANHPAWVRLEDQLAWYGSRSARYQARYKGLKFLQISLAVSITLFSHLDPEYAKWATSLAGATIAVLEGVQHMNQYATLWFDYRGIAERLKHEKFLFLAGAGPYKGLPDAERLIALAERVEDQIASEHASWSSETRRAITGANNTA